MKQSIFLTVTLSLLLGACSNSDKSVKAKLPTPPGIESRAMGMINKLQSDVTAFGGSVTNTQSYLKQESIVATTNDEILGMRLNIVASGSQSKFIVNMIERYSSCNDNTYESEAVSRQQMQYWVTLSGGLKAACVDSACKYVVVLIDRATRDSSWATPIPQAGAVILQQINAGGYTPTKSERRIFLNDTFPPEYGLAVCTKLAPSRPSPSIQLGDQNWTTGTGTNYPTYYPGQNQFMN